MAFIDNLKQVVGYLYAPTGAPPAGLQPLAIFAYSGAGSAAAPAIVNVQDLTTGILFPSPSGIVALSTSGVERVRVDGSGYVGIGTTPSYKVHIKADGAITTFQSVSGATPSLYLRFSGSTDNRFGYFGYGGSSGNLELYNDLNAPILFSTNGLTRVTIPAAGGLATNGTSGQELGIMTLTELTTIAAAATTDTAIQIPANVIVIGVSVRVTTVIPTAATFTVIGASSSTAFQTGANVSVAATTTDAGTKSCPYLNTTAQAIRITPNAQPADNTGRVRVTIHYLQVTPPTS